MNDELIRSLTESLKINQSLAGIVFREMPGDIKLLRHISSEGGMGHLFLGEMRNETFQDILNKKEYCIKLYKEKNPKEPTHIKNLPFNERDKEGNLFVDVCKIENPGMMKVKEVRENCVISEYCGDLSLEKFIDSLEKNSITRNAVFLEYFWDFLFTIYKNTYSGISHNDIKPDNIHFHEKRFKLIDLDLVSRININLFKNKNSIMGTMFFSAPEQCSNGFISSKNDVYSAGVILYNFTQGKEYLLSEMKAIKGTAHFSYADWKEATFKMQNLPFEDIGIGNKKMAEKLIQSMLNPHPEERIDIKRAIEVFYFCFKDYLPLHPIEYKKEEFGIPFYKEIQERN
jgi:serine/threonine protein kinase